MATTTNLGLYQIATTSPDYEGGNSPLAAISTALATIDGLHGTQVAAASGAISIVQGMVLITKSSTAAMTLANPTAGLPSAGGNDGQELVILSTTAHAHTVTTGTNGLNGAHSVATYTAALDFVRLRAYNGSWYAVGITPSNVAFSA